MLSAGSGTTARAAESYYYQKDPLLGVESGNGHWVGQGAESLGLRGDVHQGDFSSVLRGQEPLTGNQLVTIKNGTSVEDRRAGNDYTFSVPKSVSIAFAVGVPMIKEAHDQAVEAVARHIEQHYSHGRTTGGAVNGSLVATRFDHSTSRALDPQLHTHLFIHNMTRTADGRWLANDPLLLFQDQKKLGELYRSELAHQLQQRGHQLTWTDRGSLQFELSAVPQAVIEKFSQRREAIEQQVKLWKASGEHQGITDARLHEIATLSTRSAKDHTITAEQLHAIWAEGFHAAGSSMAHLRDAVELAKPSHTPPDHLSAKILQESARILTDNEAVIDRATLMQTAARISGGRHSLAELSRTVETQAEWVCTNHRGREMYTTSEIREIEASNVTVLKNLPEFRSVTTREEVGAYLSRLETTDQVRLTPGQNTLVLNELAGSKGFTASQGDPGTGKTFAGSVIERFNNEILKPSGRDHTVLNLAITGKAADEMAKASGRPAWTVEKFITEYHAGKIRIDNTGAQVVLRVDEASFIGARQAEHLLTIASDLQRHGIQTKLALIGDSKQMQAISAGDLFRQASKLASSGYGDFAALTEINRQKDEGLLQVATTLNRNGTAGDNAIQALQLLHQQGRITETPDRNTLLKATVDRYLQESARTSSDPVKSAAGKTRSTLLVTAMNSDRVELNQLIRQARVDAGQIEQGCNCQVQLQATTGPTADSYHTGQLVQFTGHRGRDGQMRAWGAPLQSVGTVQSVNLSDNTVRIHYSYSVNNTTRNLTKEFDAAEMNGKVSVYATAEREFSVGDRVAFLKNDTSLGVRNGQLGEITALGENKEMTVRIDGGHDRIINLGSYSCLDHAYAVTVDKSQGATVESAIMFAAVADDGKGAKESFNALNVAMTRATHEAHIMTTSLEGLGVATEKAIEKTTTVHQADLLLESARSLSHAINCLEHGQQPLDSIGTNDEIGQAGELGNAVDRLQESLHQKQDQHEYQDQGMTVLHEHHQQQDHEPTLDANSM